MSLKSVHTIKIINEPPKGRAYHEVNFGSIYQVIGDTLYNGYFYIKLKPMDTGTLAVRLNDGVVLYPSDNAMVTVIPARTTLSFLISGENE